MSDAPGPLTAALAERYTLERELGRGGAATVYLAEDRKHRRPVAVKVLRPDLGSQLGKERFSREIAIAAQLSHPHILPFIDSGEAAGLLYYITPYITGESLRQRLDREHQLPVRDAVRIAREVAAALDFAHRQGFIHRDVKPENILLSDDHAVVADFGIARAIAEAGGGEPITERGLAIGTPEYMSPEQASAEGELSARSDLYSLGCMLYEMLAGQPPFTGPNARRILARHVAERPRPLRAARPDTPPAVEEAVMRLLAKNPAERFGTGAEVMAALQDGRDAAPRAPFGLARFIAVLPFANASPEPGTEYLSDGITDELINALTKVEGLRVASRTSVFALKGKPQDVRATGALLGVSAVLEGTVRQAGDRLRVTASLTATDDGRQLWSERYDRPVGDVFAIQDDIAHTIVTTLRATYLADLAEPAPTQHTESLEAYGLYLKGRYSWSKRSLTGAAEAIKYFEQAIVADPRYALAYAGLADAYALQVDYRGAPVREGFELAKRYARQALALDPTLAEVHSSLGWVLFIYDWDWDAATAAFQRALELDPGYATAHQWYSFVVMTQRSIDLALVEGHTALELDPASTSIRRSLGWLYYYARRYDDALRHLRRAIAMDPTSEENYRMLGRVHTQRGEYSEAERALREAVSLSPETAYATGALGYLYAVRGDRAAAERIVAELEAHRKTGYVSPVAICMVYAGLGMADEVFAWLERAYEERRGWLAYLK
ncbi:MAG TPA: protein kinase, partial [Gemmatimonadales bacterium]|nr:protein kinase [Gemmatimonadales bacterium]